MSRSGGAAGPLRRGRVVARGVPGPVGGGPSGAPRVVRPPWVLPRAPRPRGEGPAPRVYAGIIVPPEPYRWESPPPNLAAGNKPPLPGDATLPIQNGQVAGGGVQTGDNQVVMYFGPGAFKAPAGATGVKCTIAPDPNPPAPPAGIEIRGHVYRGGCVALPGGGPGTIVSAYHLTLRFPPGAFKEIQLNDGTGWRPLPTLTAPGGGPHARGNAPRFRQYA